MANRSAEPPKLSAKVERKRFLESFGLDEVLLDQLRQLPVKEAQWRIESDYRAGVRFCDERRAVMVAEVIDSRPKPPPDQPDHPTFVQPKRVTGEQLG